ncbi:ATP-binding cassette domain-containing protein, partial [Candidatus Neomarinimicrobiota bacterium]
MSILEAKNIVKTYSSATASLEILKGVTFEIEPGEIVALMGPSGCGKSTLLNILGTLDKPDSGTIKINDQMIDSLSDRNLAD